MQLHDVYEAITGSAMQNHHDAGADVVAAIAIALEPTVLRHRKLGLDNQNGLYPLADKEDSIKENLQASQESVYPPLPEGWVEDPPGPPAAKRPNKGPESGPTTRASGKKLRLADYWDLHYDRAYLENIAAWSNFYAAWIRGG